MHATVLRALERCCICDACFLPRDSAPKRRTHIEACARFAGLGSDQVEDLVVKAGAQALASLRAAHEVQYAKSTLFTKMGERHVPDKRLVKLSAVIGPRLEACALASAAEEHRAARVTCRAYLQRLCVNEMPHGPRRYPIRRGRARTRAVAFHAALTGEVSLESIAADMDRQPSPFPPVHRRPYTHSVHASVPTSDDEHDVYDAYV